MKSKFLSVDVAVEQWMIPTYPIPEAEEMPMFAETSNHQGTTGNPYPNRVVSTADGEHRAEKEWTVIRLENDYIRLAVIPALGGRIFEAYDKVTGYDFLYRQHVIKPALIGAYGAWMSGGIEFNWPFHHRPSTVMPVDYSIEKCEDGSAIVWLSEHAPNDRTKGMVGVVLRPDTNYFETRVRVSNRTPNKNNFLWWENAAVAVHEGYRLVFPPDVTYVHHHNDASHTTFPIASGQYGADNITEPKDISWHKNSKHATSYFSAPSKYDFFGGFDYVKNCGVLHIADHHISPGKKMFTWGYGSNADNWEKKLTDSDGQYAELMAGCYSDNQPDLTWIQPYETKTFSQKWFPIHDKGIPTFANDNGALYISDNGELSIQATKAIKGAKIVVENENGVVFETTVDLPCYDVVTLCNVDAKLGLKINVTAGVINYFSYEIKDHSAREIPEPRRELPYFKEVKTAEELYLEGLHIEQYRSPEYSAEQCYLEALKRDPEFAPAMTALSELYLKNDNPKTALEYANMAEKSLSRFNIRHESGKTYYLKGLALLALARIDEGYDYLYKASWCYDYKSPAMLSIGLIDIRRKDYPKAIEHLTESMYGNGRSVVAEAFLGYAEYLLGNKEKAQSVWSSAIEKDKLNLYAYAFRAITTGDYKAFSDLVDTDINQVSLDISELLAEAGLYGEIAALLEGIKAYRPLSAMTDIVLSVINGKTPENAPVGIAFPSRMFEKHMLEKLLAADPTNNYARYLYGCLLYGKGNFEEGIEQFETVVSKEENYRALRNLSMGYYSHRNNKAKALELMKKAAELAPKTEKQITFECAHLMAKVGVAADEIAEFVLSRGVNRDELVVELARAYNHSGKPDMALEALLNRKFVACEGGEHYIADEYMYAHYLKGKDAYLRGDYEKALAIFRSAQILPESLGSGLWNSVKKVPYQYFEAKCLEKLGKADEAKAIYTHFCTYKFDFFTDMYLYTFAYYAARALESLGRKDEGDKLIKDRFAAWSAECGRETLGYFGTTPFFMGYIDEAVSAKKLHYSYPLYLFATYLGTDATEYKNTFSKDGYGLYIEDFTV